MNNFLFDIMLTYPYILSFALANIPYIVEIIVSARKLFKFVSLSLCLSLSILAHFVRLFTFIVSILFGNYNFLLFVFCFVSFRFTLIWLQYEVIQMLIEQYLFEKAFFWFNFVRTLTTLRIRVIFDEFDSRGSFRIIFLDFSIKYLVVGSAFFFFFSLFSNETYSLRTVVSLNIFIAGKMDECEKARWMRHVDFICHELPLPKSSHLDKLDIVRQFYLHGFVFFSAQFFIVIFSLVAHFSVSFFFLPHLSRRPLCVRAVRCVHCEQEIELATLLPILWKEKLPTIFCVHI